MPPEIPQQGPETGIETPAPVGVERVNLERPNAATESLTEQSDRISGMIADMGDKLARQRISDRIQNATADRINQSAQIIKDSQTAVDPKTKLPLTPDQRYLYQKGRLQDLANGIANQNKDIPGLGPTLNVETAHQSYELGIQSILESHELARKSIENTELNVVNAIGNTDDPNMIAKLRQGYSDYLDNSIQNGVLHPEERDLYQTHFNTIVSENLVDKLIDHNPKEALVQLMQGSMGLTPQAHLVAVAKANEKNTYALEAPQRLQKQEQDLNLDKIQKGTYNGDPWDDLQHARISEEGFKILTGKSPTNAVLLNNLMDGMQIGKFDTLQSFLNWEKENYTKNLQNLSPTDRAEYNNGASLLKRDLISEDGRDIQNRIAQINDYGIEKLSSLHEPFAMAGSAKWQAAKVQQDAIGALHQAKTLSERNAIVADTMNKINEIAATNGISSTKSRVSSKDASDLINAVKSPAEGLIK